MPYTIKLGDGKQAIGIAPIFAVQSFEAKGLEPMRQLSVNPDSVTNNGKDWSYGGGFQVGWYGQINDQLALGASYRSQMWMTRVRATTRGFLPTAGHSTSLRCSTWASPTSSSQT